MKKLCLLTSLFALAACGGGGGSSSSSGMRPSAVRAPVSEEAITSNKEITSMASEILVDSGGNAIAPAARSGSTHYNGANYTSYRLDDVDFKIGGEDSLVKFELDHNGQIVALGKYDRTDDFTGAPVYGLGEEGRFVRTGTTNEFAKALYNYSFDLNASGIGIADEHFDDIEFLDDNGSLSPAQIRQKLIAKLTKEMNKVIASQDPTNPNYTSDVANLRTALQAYITQINNTNAFDAPFQGQANLQVQGVNNATGLKYADLGFAKLTIRDSGNEIVQHGFSPYVGGYSAIKIDPKDSSKMASTMIDRILFFVSIF